LINPNSVFDAAVDQFGPWVDGVTEVSASFLNRITGAVENCEWAMASRFGDHSQATQTLDNGDVVVKQELTFAETLTRTIHYHGIMPYFDGTDSYFWVTVFWPRARDSRYNAPTLANVSVFQNNAAVSGWSASVVSMEHHSVVVQFSKSGNQCDMANGGFAVVFDLVGTGAT